MIKYFTVFAGILAVLGMNTPVFATMDTFEGNISDLPVTISDAFRLAMQNRSEIRSEDVQVSLRATEVNTAKSGFLPTVDFTAEAYHTTVYDEFSGYVANVNVAGQTFTADVNQSAIPYEINGAIRFRYNLYSGGKDQAVLEEAHANRASAEYGKLVVVKKVIQDVAAAYWELRKAQVALGISKRWREYSSMTLHIAELQMKEGKIPEIERKIAELDFHEKDIAVIQTKEEVVFRAKKYARFLGLRYKNLIDAEQIPRMTEDPDTEILLPKAVQQGQDAELSMIQEDIKAARARVKTERSEHLPNIDLFATYRSVGRDAENIDDAYRNFHRNDFVIGLQLRMNLFDGFKTRRRNEEASLKTEIARIRLEQKEGDFSLLVLEKSNNLAKAENRLHLAEKRFEVSAARVKIAEIQWQRGKLPELNYRKEQTIADEDADNLISAKIDIVLAKLDILVAPKTITREFAQK